MNTKGKPIQKLSGGYANDIWRLSFETGEKPEFVIRIFRGAVGSFVNRDLEMSTQWLCAQQKQIAAEILFRFNNGFCYRYLDGDALYLDWVLGSFDNSL